MRQSTPIDAKSYYEDDLTSFSNQQLEDALAILTTGTMNSWHKDAAQRVAKEMGKRNMLSEEELRERQQSLK